jgi:hypothetical protein
MATFVIYYLRLNNMVIVLEIRVILEFDKVLKKIILKAYWKRKEKLKQFAEMADFHKTMLEGTLLGGSCVQN